MIKIQKDVILAPFTSFNIGGRAKYFVEVLNRDEVKESLQYAKDHKLNFFVLGAGTNVLVNDAGFDGMVVKIKSRDFRVFDSRIECGTGIPLTRVVNLATENGLSGMEWAAGIPGSLGGAIAGNAGAYGKSMADVVESVDAIEVCRDGESVPPVCCTLHDCKFSYRNSMFKHNNDYVLLSVTLKLEKDKKERIEERVRNILIKRNTKIPQKVKSAGSFFKNPVIENEKLRRQYENDTGNTSYDKKIPAAWLIEEADLKGKKVGGAKISEEHANFIVNIGGAKADDVIVLASLVKQKIRTVFNVQLVEEVEYVGY